MASSGKQGPRTRSQSQPRTPSLLPEGTANTPTVATPSHRTAQPWAEVAKGLSTPRAIASVPPRPDHPFESTNQFTRLRTTEDEGSDDGSRHSDEVLLTPDATTLPPVDVGTPTRAADETHATTAVPGPTPAPPAISPSDLTAIVQATAIGLNKLQQVMEGLTKHVQTTLSQIASLSTALTETKVMAEKAFRQASTANVTLAGHGTRLDALADDIRAIPNPPDPADLHTLIQATLDPLKNSLSTTMEETVALATATAEAAIRSSFDHTATTLNERVTQSLEAFDKRIDALHGSTYGHLKKTTLPEFARRLDALEAQGLARGLGTPPPLPTNWTPMMVRASHMSVTSHGVRPTVWVIPHPHPPTFVAGLVASTTTQMSAFRRVMMMLKGRPLVPTTALPLTADGHGLRLARALALTHRATPLRAPLARRSLLRVAPPVVPSALTSSAHTVHRHRRPATALPSGPSARPRSTSRYMPTGPSHAPILPILIRIQTTANAPHAALSSRPDTAIVRCMHAPWERVDLTSSA